MMEKFYTALLAIVIIPYSLIFLMLLWNVIGPLIRIRTRRERDA